MPGGAIGIGTLDLLGSETPLHRKPAVSEKNSSSRQFVNKSNSLPSALGVSVRNKYYIHGKM